MHQMQRSWYIEPLSALSAVVAAVFWVGSTVVWVPVPTETPGPGSFVGGLIDEKDRWGHLYDVVKTIKKQSK